MGRLGDLKRFYEIISALDEQHRGTRLLETCHKRMNWPERGVYFFYEPGETRSDSGIGFRIVRIGTHAVTTASRTTLWNRLSQHQGTLKGGGGNHRGSIFRFHVGSSLIKRDGWPQSIRETWGVGSNASPSVRLSEQPLEIAVSTYIRKMPFSWLAVEDAPSPDSLRGIIERNSIALLSNFSTSDLPIDPPSPEWLGCWADRDSVRLSGLWNVNHVAELYNPSFLDKLEKLVY